MGNRKNLIILLNCVMITVAALSVVMYGIFGYSRPQGPEHLPLSDYEFFFYVAGKAWLTGMNPYDNFFPYPPNTAFLFMLLSATDLETSKLLFVLLNVFCLVLFAYLCLQLFNISRCEKPFFLHDFKSSLLVSMVIGNAAVVNILWAGQTSIIFATALLGSYYCYIRSHETRSGILLAIAFMKPQLAYTFLLWLIMERKWKTLGVSVTATIVLAIVPIYHRGLITSAFDWFGILNTYVQGENTTFWNLFGLYPLFWDFGITLHKTVTVILSIALILGIHRIYKDIHKAKLFGLLAIVALLFGQAHQYDLMLTASIMPYYIEKISFTKNDYKYFLLFCLTFMVINFPRYLLLSTDIRLLHHHRELVFIVMLFFLLAKRHEETIS